MFRAQKTVELMMAFASAALAMFFGAAVGAQAIPCRYEITQIIQADPCGGLPSPTSPRAISNHNPPWTTGYYTPCAVNLDQVFLSTGPGVFLRPTHPNIVNGYGEDITDNGWLIGSYNTLTSVRGYIYNTYGGQWIEMLPADSAGGSAARGGNRMGQIVGARNIPGGAYNAYIYQNGIYIDLGVMNGPHSDAQAINSTGAVTGWTGAGQALSGNRAFLFVNGKTTILPSPPDSTATEGWAINDEGDVAGGGRVLLPSGITRTHALHWRSGRVSDLGVLSGYRHSIAHDLNNDAIVVGECAVLDNGQNQVTACAWIAGKVMNLNALLGPSQEVYLFRAYSINNAGQIACQGYTQSGTVTVVLSPISTPTGDVDKNCRVNVDDLLFVIHEWGNSGSPADVNGDGVVNYLDLMIVLENWTVF